MRGVPVDRVDDAVRLLQTAQARGTAVYLLGNGGSAATASHFANDLVKACGIRAYSLPDMVPAVTAFGNDHEWEEMYSRLLRNLLSPIDVVVAISCSGNSANIVDVVKMVHHFAGHQIRTIALIGSDLECLVAKEKPDVLISVPHRDIRVQEDCHMIICHAIVGVLSATSQAKGVL